MLGADLDRRELEIKPMNAWDPKHTISTSFCLCHLLKIIDVVDIVVQPSKQVSGIIYSKKHEIRKIP